MADAGDLKSPDRKGREGSTPSLGIRYALQEIAGRFYFLALTVTNARKYKTSPDKRMPELVLYLPFKTDNLY